MSTALRNVIVAFLSENVSKMQGFMSRSCFVSSWMRECQQDARFYGQVMFYEQLDEQDARF